MLLPQARVPVRATSSGPLRSADSGRPAQAQGASSKAGGPGAGLEERVSSLEAALAAHQLKLVELEKLARKRGGIVGFITQYGVPFVLWYGLMWVSTGACIFMLLETGLISWQDSLRPFLESLDLDYYIDRIDPSMGNLVLALAINEILEPVRFPV